MKKVFLKNKNVANEFFLISMLFIPIIAFFYFFVFNDPNPTIVKNFDYLFTNHEDAGAFYDLIRLIAMFGELIILLLVDCIISKIIGWIAGMVTGRWME